MLSCESPRCSSTWPEILTPRAETRAPLSSLRPNPPLRSPIPFFSPRPGGGSRSARGRGAGGVCAEGGLPLPWQPSPASIGLRLRPTRWRIKPPRGTRAVPGFGGASLPAFTGHLQGAGSSARASHYTEIGPAVRLRTGSGCC